MNTRRPFYYGPLTNEEIGWKWKCASYFFAKGATGTVYVFGEEAQRETIYEHDNRIPIFWNIELPRLLMNDPATRLEYLYNDGDIWVGNSRCMDNRRDHHDYRLTTFASLVKREYMNNNRMVYPRYYRSDTRDGDCL